jgi:hypothetical protein
MKKVMLVLLLSYGLVSIGLVQTIHATESTTITDVDLKNNE